MHEIALPPTDAFNCNQRKLDKMNQPVNHSTVFRMDSLAKVPLLIYMGIKLQKHFIDCSA